jgi:hypothetical protein
MATVFAERRGGPVMAALKGRSFELSIAPLTTVERFALEHCERMAGQGLAVTQAGNRRPPQTGGEGLH